MALELKRIGVVGAGTMGSGIALAFTNAGYSVDIVDADPMALDRGMQRIRTLCAEAVKRGKATSAQADERLGRIAATSQLGDVAGCDIVIEAVYEDLALKSRIATQLGELCSRNTLLASNTSSLDIDVLAEASGRPDRYVGLHLFSPAHIMRLVEVIRGRRSSDSTIGATVELVRALSKVPIVCGVGFGFIGNRMAEPYLREADALLLEGATPAQIDAVAQSPEWLGMAMGPCRMMDLAGLDVGASIIAQRAATTELLKDASYRCVVRALSAQGHVGQKSGRGFYRYEGREAIESPESAQLARQLASEHGVQQRTHIPADEILQRLLYPLINEGFEVLREGIAADSADIDTVFTAGFGFPAVRGGPMSMAREIGLARIHAQMKSFGRQRGDPYGYWTPSPWLVDQVHATGVAA